MNNNNNKDFPIANPIKNSLIEAEYILIENTEPVTEPVTEPDTEPVIENYCGTRSCIVAGIIAIIFWPASFCVLLCPCDSRIKKKSN